MHSTEMKNKVALIGGSFDPVHLGHLMLFHSAWKYIEIEELVVIPALLSNFKQDRKPVSFEDRAEMLEQAFLDYRDLFKDSDLKLTLSRIEGERGGISFTSDTIRALYDRYAENGKVNFIIGDDLASSLDKWHDFEYLKSHVRFFCFKRDDGEIRKVDAEIHFIDSDIYKASSTDVRKGDGSLLSRRVREYIDEHHLY
ncbi:MAG: nicotinate (nicotinamide) nucleotide adenylyltransferase [Spirochaetales bacterium]|nr:nicotinate (nicotinamide) nucleotide adenylyltransferase [Spirochaetales bacterium]